MNHSPTIINLLHIIEEHNETQNHNNPTYRRYKAAMRALLKFYMDADRMDYSPEFTAQFTAEQHTAYFAGEISNAAYTYSLRLCRMLNEAFLGTSITNRADAARNLKTVCPEYAKIADDFAQHLVSIGCGGERLAPQGDARLFLYFVFNKGIIDTRQITKKVVTAFLIDMSTKRPSGIASLLADMKLFFKFLISREQLPEELLGMLDITIKKKHKIYKGFSSEEMDKILSVVDKSTVIGKRDFAILLLMRHTGLRNCDIRHMKLDDIDWNQGEINICQSKTGRMLSLPISDEAADAVSDYILNARPQTDERTIFLTTNEPYRELSETACQAIVPILSRRAGIFWEPCERRGTHGFRRSIAVNMLNGEVPLWQVSDVLGHSSMASTEPYISLDLERLKVCAGSLRDFPCTVRCLI